jgi:hypothetical protein
MSESTEDRTGPLDPDLDCAGDDGELSDEQLSAVVGGLVAWPASQLSEDSAAGDRD